MKRFLLMLTLCATAQAQNASFGESYLEYELVTEGKLIELSELHKLQDQRRELQAQVEELHKREETLQVGGVRMTPEQKEAFDWVMSR